MLIIIMYVQLVMTWHRYWPDIWPRYD